MTTSPSRVLAQYARLELNVTRERTLNHQSDALAILKEFGLHKAVQENLYVLAYGPRADVRTIATINRGGHMSVDLHIPTLLGTVMLAGAERFLIAHNHPTPDPSPTVGDIDLTSVVMEAANTCGLYFEDHLILSLYDRHFSFAAAGMLIPEDYTKLGGKMPQAASK